VNSILAAIRGHASTRPHASALTGESCTITYLELQQAIARGIPCHDQSAQRAVALALDNGPAWAVADLALMAAKRPCLPLPPFFSSAQQLHALRDAGAAWLLTDRPVFWEALLREHGITAERCADVELATVRIARFALDTRPPAALPHGTAKVTYTSGTTGTPKGVCLSAAAMTSVARSLVHAAELNENDRHVALLPLATLLENVAGVYAPLMAGACSVLLPLEKVGATEGGYRPEQLVRVLELQHATTAITVPELLTGLCSVIERCGTAPAALRFLAVGGARVSIETLQRAAVLGLPVYEGYGLSECSSVVALNTRTAYRAGSVGRALPHARIRIDDTGEIHVSGATLIAYTGGVACDKEWHATGDVGYMDSDGYLYVAARKKNIFITSYGRNVAPEWIESELIASDSIAQAWVYGESRPWNVAVITPAAGAAESSVAAALAATNHRLPPYARVKRWVRAKEPFSAANGQLTTNSRLRRDALLAAYRPLIEKIYTETIHDVLR
jgi:long-subunit acyl-CoA synthetase (AMP-forming)